MTLKNVEPLNFFIYISTSVVGLVLSEKVRGALVMRRVVYIGNITENSVHLNDLTVHTPHKSKSSMTVCQQVFLNMVK